jgi:hypothetical protein
MIPDQRSIGRFYDRVERVVFQLHGLASYR